MGLRKLCGLLLLICLYNGVDGASVLALFSSLSYADHSVFRGYVTLLTQQGHSVVVMTPYPGHFQFPEVDRIVELDVGQESAPLWDEFQRLMTNTDDHFTRLRAINEYALKLAIAQLKSKQMTALFMNPNIKFDLVVTEADVPVLYAVAEKYKAPHIALTTSSGKLHQHEAMGNPTHPLYYPDVNSINYRNNLTIWQKVAEVYRHIQTKSEYYNNYLPLCDLAAKKIFGLEKSLRAVEQDIDMLIIASNPIFTGNRPVVSATTYVGGMHIKPGLVIPQNLLALLESATKGAVYFSLGAVQESEQLSQHMLQTLTDAFAELPYTVFWKIGNTTMINKPDNVQALPWFPQQSLLAHPNVKAFITHGGPRSLEEALFYQVPIVGLPLIKSRKVFIEQLTNHGAGEILDPYYLNKETVKNVITNVVTNPEYKKSISTLKQIATDPLLSGPDNAVWWTEYVLRQKGARHLRSPSSGVTFFQYYMLDIRILYVFVVVLFIFLITYIVLLFIARRLRARFLGKPSKAPGGKFKAL